MYAASRTTPRVVVVPSIQGKSTRFSAQLLIEQFCLADWCHIKFDTTYPLELYGIIPPDEYRQSIENINDAYGRKAAILICILVFIFLQIISIFLIIVGVCTGIWVHPGLYAIMGVGVIILIFGMVLNFGVLAILINRMESRLEEAVAKESEKYSNRSPFPCSWSLFKTRVPHWVVYRGGGDDEFDQNVSFLFVQIGLRHPSMLLFSC